MHVSPIALALAVAATLMLPNGAAAHGNAGHDAHAGHRMPEAPVLQAAASPHAQHGDHAAHTAPAASRPEDVSVSLPDVLLRDQHDRALNLADDVIGDRIVVMDFVYTSCTTVCPVASAIMSQVEDRLGARVGRDVALVSISVDPARDTPSRLREYASRLGAGAGWSWLTGSAPAVNDTLKGLGTWTPDFEDHPVVTMVGDGRSGTWRRFYGFADPAQLVAQVEFLTAARAAKEH
jgi:protein SCO1/2